MNSKSLVHVFKKVFVLSMLAAGMAFTLKPGFAQMTPRQILAKADGARGNVEGIEWEIALKSIENDRTQYRVLRVKARGRYCLAEFLSPPKVKGRKLLMIDRNMWFIKPGLRKPVPISPRQKLMGGASNGDIASTDYAGDYRASQLSGDTYNEEPCYLLDLIALNRKVTYDKIRYWVSKARLVGVRAEFFTVSGKMFKWATFEYKNTISIAGKVRPFVSKMVITDALVRENVTTMIYKKVRIRKIPDSAFNLNLLVR